jgi:uncharacterized membrane protein
VTDVSPQPQVPATAPAETDARTLVIIVYGLYLGALFCGGISGLIGVVLAYIKRDDARGTVWHSHYENAIQAFWIWLGLFVLGIVTAPILIGFAVIGVAFLYFIYRTVKGLIAAIDSKPYA